MHEESDYGAELYVEETMVPLMDPEKWVTKQREVWLITEMEIQHLINVVEYLRDDRIAYGQGWKLPHLEEELERRLRAERIERLERAKPDDPRDDCSEAHRLETPPHFLD